MLKPLLLCACAFVACVCVWKKCILFFIRTKVCNEKSKRCTATHRRIDFIRNWAGNFPPFLASLTVVRAWSISPPPFPSTPSIDPSAPCQRCFEYLLCNFSLHATEIQKKKKITSHTQIRTHSHTQSVCSNVILVVARLQLICILHALESAECVCVCFSCCCCCCASYKCEKIATYLNKMQMSTFGVGFALVWLCFW